MYLGTCISCIICTCILYHMYLCLYLYHICTCMACILPNCWDCSQSESRTQSRPKAVFLPSIRKSTESLAKVIVLSLAVTSFSKRGLPQSISPEKSLIHQMSFGCLAASEISRVGKFFQIQYVTLTFLSLQRGLMSLWKAGGYCSWACLLPSASLSLLAASSPVALLSPVDQFYSCALL